MNMSLAGLRDVYQELAAAELAASGEACPPPEDLLRCLSEEATRKEREGIIGHLTRCVSCAAETRVLLDVAREGRLIARAVENELRPAPFHRRFGEFLSRLAARPAVAIYVLVFAAALATLFVSLPSTKRPLLRGNAREVRLIAPMKASVSAERVELCCRAFPNAKAYIFELWDSELAFVWRSEPQEATKASPPKTILDSMKPGETYFWMATAILDNDTRVKSKLTEFAVKK